jgi:hypothetical protein
MVIWLEVDYSNACTLELLNGVSECAKDWRMGSDKAVTTVS